MEHCIDITAAHYYRDAAHVHNEWIQSEKKERVVMVLVHQKHLGVVNHPFILIPANIVSHAYTLFIASDCDWWHTGSIKKDREDSSAEASFTMYTLYDPTCPHTCTSNRDKVLFFSPSFSTLLSF